MIVKVVLLVIISVLPLLEAVSINALYQCGIRKRFGVQLVHHGWIAELGQWPWHVALFHRSSNGRAYRCGGTLIDERHVLTSAHCIVRSNGYPMKAVELLVHLGQHDLREQPIHVQVMNVSEVHMHPEFELNRNDITLLVLSSVVQYSDYVIPICLDAWTGKNPPSLDGNRGWITGWGQLENGTLPRLLRTAQMPVVSHLQCLENDPVLFGRFLNPAVFCAGDRNGTSVCKGDSGGGMYFSEGDRFVLKGIVSFSGMDEKSNCDTSKYIVFANVGCYLQWIKNLTTTDGNVLRTAPKRISEIECDRYRGIAKKRGNGICYNSRSPHSVTIVYEGDLTVCSGIIVSESYVLFPCHCSRGSFVPEMVRIGFSSYNIENITCHPEYKTRNIQHDLALIKLNGTVSLSPSILPTCLANNWTENLYETLLVTGHVGAGEGQEFIESVENRVVAKGQCNLLIPKYRDSISDGEICVLNNDPERTESERLPGAALQTMSTRTCMFNLLGIQIATSTDILTRTEPLDLYARVAHHLDWMEKIIWKVEVPQRDALENSTELPEIAVENITIANTDFEQSTKSHFLNREFVFPDHPFLNRSSRR
ncbi:polyserase-2-like [Malaya genurostris]|uniref:polyserase-2-like n=1 Tax=Malaya genurostris TaxID=325434 RepID=UPI0026F3979F|nr:polyserase-2-like [Malaya genurostris]